MGILVSVQQTLDGGYIVSGSSTITPNESFFIIKTNANGRMKSNSQTFREIGSNAVISVQQGGLLMEDI